MPAITKTIIMTEKKIKNHFTLQGTVIIFRHSAYVFLAVKTHLFSRGLRTLLKDLSVRPSVGNLSVRTRISDPAHPSATGLSFVSV